MDENSQAGVSHACSGEAAVFESYLAQTGKAFLLTGESNGQRQHVRFIGTFEGRQVVWDCEFVTLASEFSRITDRVGDEVVQGLRCFIEIGVPAVHGIPIRVGLNVALIDAAEIQKMIVMVRNYKRLRRGRYEFGDGYRP